MLPVYEIVITVMAGVATVLLGLGSIKDSKKNIEKINKEILKHNTQKQAPQSKKTKRHSLRPI